MSDPIIDVDLPVTPSFAVASQLHKDMMRISLPLYIEGGGDARVSLEGRSKEGGGDIGKSSKERNTCRDHLPALWTQSL